VKPQPKCPECEKLAEVSEESNKIGGFLGWLFSKDLVIAGYEHNTRGWEELVVVRRYQGDSGINKLLAEYYGIDLDKVEKERRALLNWLREQNGDQ
jgi:hypothetical protein